MDDVREQILSYPQLPAEEQRAVETYVEAHPEWASLFRDVRRIESSLREVEGHDPILITYVVAQEAGLDELSSELEDAFAHLERALDTDDELQAQADEIRSQFDQAEAELDPVSHFESTTGHSLSDVDEPGPTPNSPSADKTRSSSEASKSSQAQGEWPLSALPYTVRGIGAGLAGLLAAYLVLFGVDWATQSTLDRLSAIDVSDQMIDSYYSSQAARPSSAADPRTADAVYLRSLSTLRQAETSTLGLFREYRPDSLRRAENGLRRVLDRTEPSSFLASEARFYLGKIALLRGRVETARPHFEAVIQQDGRRAAEARRILEHLEERETGPEADGGAS